MRVCSPCPRSSQSGGVSLMPDETIAVDARSLVHGVACGTASSFGNVVFAHASYAQKDVVSMISVDKRRGLYWHPRHIVTCEAHASECASGISPGLTTLFFFPEKHTHQAFSQYTADQADVCTLPQDLRRYLMAYLASTGAAAISAGPAALSVHRKFTPLLKASIPSSRSTTSTRYSRVHR